MNCAEKIIRANSLLQFIHQVTIEFRFRKSLAQERFNLYMNGYFELNTIWLFWTQRNRVDSQMSTQCVYSSFSILMLNYFILYVNYQDDRNGHPQTFLYRIMHETYVGGVKFGPFERFMYNNYGDSSFFLYSKRYNDSP